MPFPPESMIHSASSVPSMMTSPRESIQHMSAWVVVDMVRLRAEVSSLPVWKLLRSSVRDIQMVWGWALVAAKMRRDSWTQARAGYPKRELKAHQDQSLVEKELLIGQKMGVTSL